MVYTFTYVKQKNHGLSKVSSIIKSAFNWKYLYHTDSKHNFRRSTNLYYVQIETWNILGNCSGHLSNTKNMSVRYESTGIQDTHCLLNSC